MSDPTIDVELGTAIHAMLQRTGYLDDVHDAISDGLGSFKFIRSFRKTKGNVSRKKSRIKKRSISRSLTEPLICSSQSRDTSTLPREGKFCLILFFIINVVVNLNTLSSHNLNAY